MPIHEWPALEQPREKLLHYGPTRLTDAELIAVLIGCGIKGKSAVDVGRDLLIKTGGVRALFNMKLTALPQLPGIGRVNFTRMQAALELSRRCLQEQLQQQGVLESVEATKAFLQSHLQDLPQEVFACLMLDNQHRVIVFETLFHGTIDHAPVYPRELLRSVLKYNAAAVILVHNHPSGRADPSRADLQLTLDLQKILRQIGVRVLDHFIVGDGEIISLAERGNFLPT